MQRRYMLFYGGNYIIRAIRHNSGCRCNRTRNAWDCPLRAASDRAGGGETTVQAVPLRSAGPTQSKRKYRSMHTDLLCSRAAVYGSLGRHAPEPLRSLQLISQPKRWSDVVGVRNPWTSPARSHVRHLDRRRHKNQPISRGEWDRSGCAAASQVYPSRSSRPRSACGSACPRLVDPASKPCCKNWALVQARSEMRCWRRYCRCARTHRNYAFGSPRSASRH